MNNEAESLLDAEAKLGELLAAIPNKKASSGGGTRSLPYFHSSGKGTMKRKDLLEEIKPIIESSGQGI